MMTESEFIDKTIGTVWVNRGDDYDGIDCYGLIKLYYRDVMGLELKTVKGYKEGYRFDTIWQQNIEKQWRQVGRWQKGAMVTFYDNANKPVHVGVCVGNMQVLHARGSVDQDGKVEIHNIATLQKAYKNSTFHGAINA